MNFYTNIYEQGNFFLVRGYEDGRRFSRKVRYQPHLFLPSKTETEYRTIDGRFVDKMNFDTIWEARDFCKKYDDVAGFEYFGIKDYLETYINDEYEGEIEFDSDLISVVSIDIENDKSLDTKNTPREITAITISKKGKYLSFGCGDYTPVDPTIEEYIKCDDEAHLLKMFLTYWNKPEWIPDVVTGWNVRLFDVPYLYNRIVLVLGESYANQLSPHRVMKEKTGHGFRGKFELEYEIAGITILDYMDLDKKFSYKKRENNRLDTVANEVLGIGKLDYSEYDSLFDMHKRDFQKFMEYNHRDVELIEMMEERQGFIEQVFYLAYDAKVNYIDTLATVKPWTIIFHNYLISKGIVMPSKRSNKMTRDLIGGFVKEPIPAKYDNVVSFDYTSLYPSLIRHYNISPDTFVKKLTHHGITDVDEFTAVKNIMNGMIRDEIEIPEEYSMTANLCLFRKDIHGFIPEMMEKLFNDRVRFKNLMKQAKKEYEINPTPELKKKISRYNNMQMTRKIQLNACYGALGNEHFVFFDINLAEAITLSGQLAIQWVQKDINNYLNKIMKTNKDWIIAVDTDSCYVCLDDLVKKLGLTGTNKIANALDQFSKEKLQPIINQSMNDLLIEMNAYEQCLFMKREVIASRAVWRAKKQYVMDIIDDEGVRLHEPKLKAMGVEIVKSSTPAVVRKALKEAVTILLRKEENDIIAFIEDFKEKFFKMPFEEIAFPRGVNNLEKYTDARMIYGKGTPMHVRASLLYNNLVHKYKVTEQYPPIDEGSRIKFCYLKKPNSINENVIACVGKLPDVFDLNKFVDYDTQFVKTFLDPLRSLLGPMGWKTEKCATLESFFD
ncbi:MAG: DNA polymerase domain-containing protein [Legionella sp.]|uniref:DNA polymerase domain-containing protein n=1 Tax=Legionella sp. TaxID=459 RepID=UPI00283D79DD|nr:DNA polymerase domain-containing protein [Legionella sp.]